MLSIERAAFAADPLGPARGNRHALLEAGLVGVDPTREWVVHFAALGVRGASRLPV